MLKLSAVWQLYYLMYVSHWHSVGLEGFSLGVFENVSMYTARNFLNIGK